MTLHLRPHLISRHRSRAHARRHPHPAVRCLLVCLLCCAAPGIAIARDAAGEGLQQVPLPYSFHDNQGTQWDVQADGCIGQGNADIYDAGGRLFIAGNQPYAPNVQTAQFDPAHAELLLPPQSMAGLNVSRRISVDAKEGWCRWVEILENPTTSAVKTPVHVNFDLGGNVQSSQPVSDDAKTHKQIGLAVFDGTRGIAMLGAGSGGTVLPTFAPQQGNDQVDVTWDVEVPPHKTICIVHLQAVRPTVNEAQSFLTKFTDPQVLRDLPPQVLKCIVNFAAHSSLLGDLELLRGDLLDAVELRGGDQYKGTLLDKSFTLQTSYGQVSVPADKVLSIVCVGEFRPIQLLVTRDGEAYGGALDSPVIHLQLSSGQVTPIPLTSIRRLGYRKRAGEPEDFKYEHPMLMLRDGDRIAVQMPAEPIAVATRFGNLQLEPRIVGGLLFQGDDQPMHQVLLADGSRIAGLVGKEKLELMPLTIGASVALQFPAAAITRLQLVQHIPEPDEHTPTLTLSTGDRMVGTLSGKLLLETAFDAITIDGAEVRGLRHAGTGPAEVQLTLWDDATLSGRLKGDELSVALKCGPTLHVPAALVDQYAQPQPMPPASIQQHIRGLVADLASDDWKRADRASADLSAMGSKIAGALRTLKIQQAKGVQDRIEKILVGLDAPPAPPTTRPAENAAGN